jgi:hypothetical protein
MPNSKPERERRRLVLELIGLAAVAAGLAWLVTRPSCAGADEPAAVRELKVIAAAEQIFHGSGLGGATPRYATSLEELAAAHELPVDRAQSREHGYALRIVEAGPVSFSAVAEPLDCPEARAFFIDETEVVRVGRDASGPVARIGLPDAISGRVLDLARRPVARATVGLLDGTGLHELARVDTDAKGAFRLAAGEGDVFRIRVLAPREVAAHIGESLVRVGGPGWNDVVLGERPRLRVTLEVPVGAPAPAAVRARRVDRKRGHDAPDDLAAGPFADYRAVTVYLELSPTGPSEWLLEADGFAPVGVGPYDPESYFRGFDGKDWTSLRDPAPAIAPLEALRNSRGSANGSER